MRSNLVVFGNNVALGGRCYTVLIFFDNERHLEIEGVGGLKASQANRCLIPLKLGLESGVIELPRVKVLPAQHYGA